MSDDLATRFDELYRENQAKVYRLALSLAGNVHDAEDITQEAFFRAFRSYHTFREDSSFFTWIYRITVNVANDYLKHRTKLPIYELTEDHGFALEDVIDPDPASNPETELLASQVRVKCLHCMTECLPLEQRKVFCLAIMIDLPHKQVAEILECSPGSVKTTLHRAKKRWFGYMEDKCEFIKRSNPCNCRQFVRFGLSRGWVSKESSVYSPPPPLQVKEEILSLRSLRDFYKDLFQNKADESFTRRLREGIQKKEWSIFS
ncbi:MAG: RNA polymerase subunit sigma-24 [Nitrospirae bacterium GWC2_57_9]|nr:MAG: RNA polymerase subunit sigma-24 [Nitrospirae bacterium GWC2_57_9]